MTLSRRICKFASVSITLAPDSDRALLTDSYVLQTSPDHSGRNGRSNSTGRRGVPRGVHRRRGGGYHRVGGPGGGESETPAQESSEREWVGGGGVETPSSCPVQNTWRICNGCLHFTFLGCFARVLCGQTPPKPAKKALNVSRGVQKPAMWSLGRSFG